MNKLLFLSILAIFALRSSNAFGQAGLTPHAGATHTYWVNTNDLGDVNSGHLESHDGNTYTWEVLRAGGNEASSSDYQIIGENEGENLNSVQILWNSAAIADGGAYFLVVTEEAEGCTNKKAIQIDPENAFAVTIENVDADLNDVGASKTWCAPDISLNLADASISYDYGSTTLYYLIDATGLDAGWSFEYAFAETGKDPNATVTAFWGTDVAGATTTLDYINGGSVSVSDGTQDVIIKVVIANGTSAEGKNADHNIQLTLSQFSDGVNVPISINGATLPLNSADIDQTIKARPATSGIQSN